MCQIICFAKFLNIWFVSQLSKSLEVWLMHSSTHFALAEWGAERGVPRYFQVALIPRQDLKRGKDKWRAIGEWSSPPGLRLFTWSMSSQAEPTLYVCAPCMCAHRGSKGYILKMCWNFCSAFSEKTVCDPRKQLGQSMRFTLISICLAAASVLEELSPLGDASATSACFPLFHSVTQSDTRRQVN